MNYWQILPLDVVKLIFNMLQFKEQIAFKSSCKRFQALPIRKIPIGLCQYLTNDILKQYPNLEYVSTTMSKVTNKGLKYLPKLLELYASLSFITDRGLQYVPNLRVLSTSDQMSDKGLKYVPHLKYLSIQQNLSITNQGLQYVPHLTKLYIMGWTSLTSDCLQYLPCLEQLFIITSTFKFKGADLQHTPLLRVLYIPDIDISLADLKYAPNLELKKCYFKDKTITEDAYQNAYKHLTYRWSN